MGLTYVGTVEIVNEAERAITDLCERYNYLNENYKKTHTKVDIVLGYLQLFCDEKKIPLQKISISPKDDEFKGCNIFITYENDKISLAQSKKIENLLNQPLVLKYCSSQVSEFSISINID